VSAQIGDEFRPLPPTQIVGATDHGQRLRRRQSDGDHIGLDELAEPDAGVKSFGRDIDQIRSCSDLDLDLGIGSQNDATSFPSRIGTTARGAVMRNSPAGRCPRSRATSLAATSSSNAALRAK